MPFPKRGSGGKREGAGEPSKKGIGDKNRTLGKEEQKEYDRSRQAQHRKQAASPTAREGSRDQIEAEVKVEKPGPGRPPKNDSGPMTVEETVESNKQSVRKGRLRKKRQAAAFKRWKKDDVPGEALLTSDEEYSDEEDERDSDLTNDEEDEKDGENNDVEMSKESGDEVKLSNDKEEEDNVKPEEVKSEEMYGSMSKRHWPGSRLIPFFCCMEHSDWTRGSLVQSECSI